MRIQRVLALVAGLLLVVPPSAQAQFGQGGQGEALIGDFVLVTSEDPITDASQSFLMTDSEGTIPSAESVAELNSAVGQLELTSLLMSGAVLAVYCSGQDAFPHVMVINRQAVWVGEGQMLPVTVRFDSETPEKVQWGGGKSVVGATTEQSSLQFLKRARPSRKVAIRYTDDSDNEHTHVFSLMGLTDGLQRLSCQ